MSDVNVNKPRTYNLKEVADLADVSDKTVRRWYQTGKVPEPHRDRNNRPAFTESDVKAIVRFAHQLNPPSSRRAAERARAS